MSKKILYLMIVLLSISITVSAADFWLGPNAFYAAPINPQDVTASSVSGIGIEDLAFGAEGRLYMKSLSLSVNAEYLGNKNIYLLSDVGLNIDLFLFRFGLGLGPNLGINLNGGKPSLGGNLKALAEVKLGGFSVGLTWFSMIEFNKSSIADAFKNPYGFLGVGAMFRL